MPTPDGRAILVLAPADGGDELWRIEVADGALERLTAGKHYLSSFHVADSGRRACGSPPSGRRPRDLPDVHVGRLTHSGRVPAGSGGGGSRRADAMTLRPVTAFNEGAPRRGRAPARPRADGRRSTAGGSRAGSSRPGTGRPAGRTRSRPALVAGAAPARAAHARRSLQIHGGPHTLYGWSPFWEFQVLAGAGMSVFYANPRGSEGYGRDFNEAQHRRLGRRPDARRPRRRRRPRGRRARRPRPARRDRRLVRRLPDELDRRPRPALRGRHHLPLRERPASSSC